MSRKDEIFKPALKGKKIPILTLDNKWHKLFAQKGKPRRLEKLAEELNTLLRRQGKVNTQIKEVKALKKRLMDGIMVASENLHTGKEEGIQEKKLAQSRRLIEECNEKLGTYEDEQLDIPRLIERKNYDLMLMTMDICYDTLKENAREIEKIDGWIQQIRIELKRNMVLKQEMEDTNQRLYSYMHDIFGADVIELFDMKYHPDGE